MWRKGDILVNERIVIAKSSYVFQYGKNTG